MGKGVYGIIHKSILSACLEHIDNTAPILLHVVQFLSV